MWDPTTCFICNKSVSEGETSKVTKGLETLIRVSKERKDEAYTFLQNVGMIEVHKACRHEYIKQRNIEKHIKQKAEQVDDRSLRSSSSDTFNFKQECFICAEKCDLGAERKKNCRNVEECMKFAL